MKKGAPGKLRVWTDQDVVVVQIESDGMQGRCETPVEDFRKLWDEVKEVLDVHGE